jgi:hypothetical protein
MRGGVFCHQHDILHGVQCRVQHCSRIKLTGTQACAQHQEQWYQHIIRYGCQSLSGFTRLLRRSETENQPWLPQTRRYTAPHDQPGASTSQCKTYFQASRFYCVETICAPCGVVIAWAKFAKSESPTNILAFLESVFPTEESRPDYVCIDKACLVLKSCVANGTWETWKKTTRFIVDSYHYINHRVEDSLYRTWCNPAPLNGSAPNLVVVEVDRNGEPHYKCAFNT